MGAIGGTQHLYTPVLVAIKRFLFIVVVVVVYVVVVVVKKYVAKYTFK